MAAAPLRRLLFFIAPRGLFFIEIDDLHILFTVGYADAFLANGVRMGIDFMDMAFHSRRAQAKALPLLKGGSHLPAHENNVGINLSNKTI